MSGLPLLVFVGVATEDSIAVVERYPSADERVVAKTISAGGGGPAATAAVAAARLGMRAAVIAVVGDDDAGRAVRARLAAEGVDVSGIRVVPGAETSRSIVIISGAERSRAIVNRPGPAIDLAADPIARDLIDAAAWVHVDQHGWPAVRDHLSSHTMSARLSVDAGNAIADLRLEDVALYAPTLAALRTRYRDAGLDDVASLMRSALADGADAVVVTDGADGSYALERGGDVVHVDAPRTEVVSTLGAGDVFHGALLAGLVGAEVGTIAPGIEAVTAYATTVATLSCRGIDGRSRIPDHDEATRYLDDRHRGREEQE